MDLIFRALVFCIAGLGLLAVNLWFVRSTMQSFFASDYRIHEFSVIDPKGEMPDGAGRAMAQMTVARLLQIQSRLSAAQETATVASSENLAVTSDYFGATALFVTRPVDIPTDLFEPIDVQVAVGGVEVGGVLTYIQNALGKERAIFFSVHEVGDSTVLSGNLGDFAPTYEPLWFATNSNDFGEIATHAAYALLHARLTELQPGPLEHLNLAEFRALIEAITGLDEANKKARLGRVAEDDLARHLATLEELLTEVPEWPEIIFLIANTAESLDLAGKARLNYRKLARLDARFRTQSNVRIFDLANARLAAYGTQQTSEQKEEEARFIEAASEFARRMNLPGPDPAIVFMQQGQNGFLGNWVEDENHYQVTPDGLKFKGMPQYIALTGRFLAQHLGRCFPPGSAGTSTDHNFWNEFRYSVTDYLISSHPDFADFKTVGQDLSVYAALKRVETQASVKAAQRLGLALLDGFDCAWNYGSLADAAERISNDLQIAEVGVVRAAFQSTIVSP